MDYRKLFKFRASVDWLAFEIETDSHKHGDTIFKKCRLSNYVTKLNEGPGGVATRFVVRFQDIKSWDDAQARLDALAARFPLAPGHEPTIAGIEVSFDAFARTATRADLVDMATRFFKFGNLVSDNYRFGGRFKGDAEGIHSYRWMRGKLGQDRVINIGDKTDTLSQRVYFKATDNKKPLAIREHRARMELTMHGDALPFTTLADARGFDFATLAEYFSYRKTKAGLTVGQAAAADAAIHLGSRVERRRKSDRSKRQYSDLTRADGALNARAKKALGRLTERMGGTAHK